MPTLPRMPAVNPTVVPASAGGTFPDWYNTLLLARPLAMDGKGTCSLRFSPYNWETGAVLDDPARQLSIDRPDFWAYALGRPALAQALGYLTEALGLAAREAELERLIAAELLKDEIFRDNETLSAWQAALDETRAALGMQP